MTSDSSSSRAGEYVLGTLTGPERDAFEATLAADPELRAEVLAWEKRLAPLAGTIAPKAPSLKVWAAIARKLDSEDDTQTSYSASPAVTRLRRSVALWRSVSAAATALAAALALFIVLDGRWPGLEREQNYVAVVNRGGDLPALIVRVDLRQGVVRLRSIAAEAPPSRSLELWYIGAGQAPRSLGVLVRPPRPIAIPAAVRRTGIEGASIAVTVEPEGGAPGGVPTGPVVYSGKLIKEQP